MLVVRRSRSIQVLLGIGFVARSSLPAIAGNLLRLRDIDRVLIVRAIALVRFPLKKLSPRDEALLPTCSEFSVFNFLTLCPGIRQRTEIRSDPKRENFKTGGHTVTPGTKGGLMNLSVETKVAIAVATSFVVLMVGAMAQG